MLRPISVSPIHRRQWSPWSSVEGPPDVWGLEHTPCEERLRNQGFAQPGEATTLGAPNSSPSGGSYQEVRAELLWALQGWRARKNRLKSREVQTVYKIIFLPNPVTKRHGYGAQRGGAVSGLGGFQHTTGSSPVEPGPTPQVVQTWDLLRSLSTWIILWFSLTQKKVYLMSHSEGFHVTHAGVSFIPS